MNVTVTLKVPGDGYYDQVVIDNIENDRCFTYSDNNGDICEICIYDDGMCFFKQSDGHLLELHLHDNYYAKITTEEGIVTFEVKVVDFTINNDILVMHYIVNDEARIIEIRYC